MRMNKYTEKEKEYQRLKVEAHTFWSTDFSEEGHNFGRYYKYRNKRPIEFVPAKEKQFLGWDLEVILHPNIKRDRELISKLLQRYFGQIYIRKPEIIKIIRSNGKNYKNSMIDLERYSQKHSNWQTRDLSKLFSFRKPFNVYKGDFTEEELINIKNYLITVREPNFFGKLEQYTYLYKLPTHNFEFKITKVYSSEIGLLCSDWEKKNDDYWYNLYGNYDYINITGQSRNHWRDRYKVAKSLRTKIKSRLNLIKNEDVNDYEIREKYIIRSSKIFRGSEHKRYMKSCRL